MIPILLATSKASSGATRTYAFSPSGLARVLTWPHQCHRVALSLFGLALVGLDFRLPGVFYLLPGCLGGQGEPDDGAVLSLFLRGALGGGRGCLWRLCVFRVGRACRADGACGCGRLSALLSFLWLRLWEEQGAPSLFSV